MTKRARSTAAAPAPQAPADLPPADQGSTPAPQAPADQQPADQQPADQGSTPAPQAPADQGAPAPQGSDWAPPPAAAAAAARKPRGVPAADNPIDEAHFIRVLHTGACPKRGAAADRYAYYQDGQQVKAYVDAVVAATGRSRWQCLADVRWDRAHEWVAVVPEAPAPVAPATDEGAAPEAPAPVAEQPAPQAPATDEGAAA